MTDEHNPFAAPENLSRPASPLLNDDPELLRQIASRQRMLIAAIVISLGATIGTPVAGLFFGVLWLPQAFNLLSAVFSVVAMFRLTRLLRGAIVAVLYSVLAAVPLIGLLLLVQINNEASTRLKKNGIRVGFLGASPDSV